MSGVFGNPPKKWEFVVDVYDSGTDGVLATVETPDFEDGFEYRLDIDGLAHGSGSYNVLEIEYYKETDAAYTVIQDTDASGNNTHTMIGQIYMPTVRYSIGIHSFIGGMDDIAATQWKDARGGWTMTPQKITKARLAWAATNLTVGIIRLYRRAL